MSTTVDPSAAIVSCSNAWAVNPVYVLASASVLASVVPVFSSVSAKVYSSFSIFCLWCFTVYFVSVFGSKCPSATTSFAGIVAGTPDHPTNVYPVFVGVAIAVTGASNLYDSWA